MKHVGFIMGVKVQLVAFNHFAKEDILMIQASDNYIELYSSIML
jgi:hypothetical protein